MSPVDLSPVAKTRRRTQLENTSRKPAPQVTIAPEYSEDLHSADLTIDNLNLTGLKAKIRTTAGKDVYRRMRRDIAGVISDASIQTTIDGASTVTLTVFDPDRAILNSGVLSKENFDLDPVDIRLNTLWFRLTQCRKKGHNLNLVFEDRDVWRLRQKNKPRSVSRGKATRAQFIESLVREIQDPAIEFYCPEKDIRQPIKRIKDDPTEKRKDRQVGISDTTLTIKGVKADAEQLRNVETLIRRADANDASPKATKALILAAIVESLCRNLKGGDATSSGILQVLAGTAAGLAIDPRNIPDVADTFLNTGFWGRGGAISLASANPGQSAGWVAQQAQGSAYPGRYDLYSNEADKLIGAYRASDGSIAASGADGSVLKTRIKQYRFYRGKKGKREDSWTCIQRLAKEVNWHAFMRNGELWFITEPRLLAQRPLVTLNEDSPGVTKPFDFDWDSGKKIKQMTIYLNADRWSYPPGSVIVIEDSGPCDGKWIVAGYRRSLFRPEITATLKRRTPPKKEPASQRIARSGNDSTLPGGGAQDVHGLRKKILQVAKSSMTIYTGHNYYLAGGILTDKLTPKGPSERSDCSQWVRAVYLHAGAPDPGTNTYSQDRNGHRTSHPRPGDLLMMDGHVELYIGNGRTIGHGSPPIDYANVSDFKGRNPWFITFDFLDN